MRGRRLWVWSVLLPLCFCWLPARAHALTDLPGERAALARSSCAALTGMVDAAAASGPVFIASYPTATNPALKDTAFVYDNALAVIALIACGQVERASRIAQALRIAAAHDRFWHDGRLRNAYRAGAVAADAPPALPGWWDAAAKRWDEDLYQVGTATGNVAWAALALAAMDRARASPADRAAAVGLMRWLARTVAVDRPVAGFSGGFFGEEPAPVRLGWESTEHNVDAAAAFGLLAPDDPGFAAAGARARGFVTAMWDGAAGRFWLGTDAAGRGINRSGSGIDAQLWPLIGIAGAPASWARARDFVRAHHAVGGGFGFADAPDAIWTEGTAQAALSLPDPSRFGLLLRMRAPDGLLYATPQERARTGLALTPDSVTDDFYYFHLPHVGATAWSILAATETNPFAPR